MASAMCQANPTFYSDCNAKSLFICVSENFYEKFIDTQEGYVSNHSSLCPVENCKFHLVLIESSLDQILLRLDKYHIITKLLTVFILCKITDFISLLFHQEVKFSIN